MPDAPARTGETNLFTRVRGRGLAVFLGAARLVRGSPFPLGVAFVVLGLLPAAAAPVFVLVRVLLNTAAPVAETYLKDRTPSFGRATLISGWSMAISVASIPVKLVSGPLADVIGLHPTVGVRGAASLVVSVEFSPPGSRSARAGLRG